MDKHPQELHRESEVGLLDGPLWLSYLVSTLSINLQVQDQEVSLSDGSRRNWPSLVKLGSERGPSNINTLAA